MISGREQKSDQDQFILMQELHLDGAVSSLGLGRKLEENEFENMRTIDASVHLILATRSNCFRFFLQA